MIPAYMNAQETMALRETTGEDTDLRQNNLVRIIVGVKRADKRK